MPGCFHAESSLENRMRSTISLCPPDVTQPFTHCHLLMCVSLSEILLYFARVYLPHFCCILSQFISVNIGVLVLQFFLFCSISRSPASSIIARNSPSFLFFNCSTSPISATSPLSNTITLQGKYCREFNGVFYLVAIAGVAMLSPSHVVKSLQPISGSGTHKWHLQVSNLQMSCSDIPLRKGTRIIVPVITAWVMWLHLKQFMNKYGVTVKNLLRYMYSNWTLRKYLTVKNQCCANAVSRIAWSQ